MKNSICSLPACLIAVVLGSLWHGSAAAQTPTSPGALTAPVATPTKAPKLTPEQRQEYARAKQSVITDAEYTAAVTKAIEAQKAADRMFFSKLIKAAPDLRDYISYLRSARGLGPAVKQQP